MCAVDEIWRVVCPNATANHKSNARN